MEILSLIVSFILLLGLVISPILLSLKLHKSKIKYKFSVFLALSIPLTFIIITLFGWWSSQSNELLLAYYGYDFEAMNDHERFANVSAKNIERVKSLEMSMMGIGWPAKVIISYIAYSPYLALLYCVAYFINRIKGTATNSG
jgi:hypothetical protein